MPSSMARIRPPRVRTKRDHRSRVAARRRAAAWIRSTPALTRRSIVTWLGVGVGLGVEVGLGVGVGVGVEKLACESSWKRSASRSPAMGLSARFST